MQRHIIKKKEKSHLPTADVMSDIATIRHILCTKTFFFLCDNRLEFGKICYCEFIHGLCMAIHT